MRIKKLDILNESEFRENVLLLGHNHHFAENIVLKTNGGISVKREISIRLLRS